MIRNEILVEVNPELAQDGKRIAKHVAVTVVEGDAKHFALALATQQASGLPYSGPVPQPLHPDHLAAKATDGRVARASVFRAVV